MSTVKVNEVRHLSNTGSANVVLESNGDTNLKATSTLGLTVVGTLTVSGISTFNGNVQVGNASTDTMALTSTVSGFNNFSGFTGEIRMYAGNAAGDDPPDGWLYCNGDTISSTIDDGGVNAGGTHYNADGKGNDYQPLFNLLKASDDWGNLNSYSWGTNKVKLPDFRSRSPVGIATGAANGADARSTGIALASLGTGLGLTARTLGDTVGTEGHVLLLAQLAQHTHVLTTSDASPAPAITLVGGAVTITNPTHTHTTYTGAQGGTYATSSGTGGAHGHDMWYVAGAYSNADASYNSVMIGNRNVARSTHGSLVHSVGDHTHGISHTHANSTTSPTAASQVVSYTQPTASMPQHSHTTTAATTGTNSPHTILSPIIAVNYIIKV